ncbi:hypothetical protein CDD82_3373 [Ophiocordyceps australis]|uniref:Uncharacterized protein n=1 Tax=Ophiocordyceps australis TaxID=1399860 RepID=A0A2C5Z7C8_9HYPO|nr:hypothetical protein CDD82_3373 [Ophiocordyceps australis]
MAQPNFTRAADSLRDTAVELERFGNLPVLDVSDRLLDMMQFLMNRFNVLEQKVSGRSDAFEQRVLDRFDAFERRVSDRFDALEQRVSVSNKNFLARMQNSLVVHATVELVPLYSFITGLVLPDFPATLADLDNVSSQAAAQLLRHLDEPIPRGLGLDQRRKQLRVAFGVRMWTA